MAGGDGADDPQLQALRSALLDPAEAEGMRAPGRIEAAVLIPVYGWPRDPGLLLTERKGHLRRHAGEISFPGGRRDPGESLADTALREAEEEIGLARGRVELLGALPPVGTLVTGYKIHPFVGAIGPPEELGLEANPDEVATLLSSSVQELVAGRERRRVPASRIPLRTDTFTVSGKLVWGATARILSILLGRLEPPQE